jgi:hypothetical protein
MIAMQSLIAWYGIVDRYPDNRVSVHGLHDSAACLCLPFLSYCRLITVIYYTPHIQPIH